MKTDSAEYYKYLSQKYLPGRSLFLKYIYYPKILKIFKFGDTIWDFGCGTGEFLYFCKKKNRKAQGIDSNKNFVSLCKKMGFLAEADNVCRLKTLSSHSVSNGLIDNVLEHLTVAEINHFFEIFEKKASDNSTLICIVPGPKGFKKDPTHKTYVDKNLLLSIFENKNFKITKQFSHPFPMDFVNKFLYLNMQVFIIKKV